MSNYSKLKVFEPLEEIKNNLYWKVYVEERDAQAKLNEPEKVVVKKIIEKSGIKVS